MDIFTMSGFVFPTTTLLALGGTPADTRVLLEHRLQVYTMIFSAGLCCPAFMFLAHFEERRNADSVATVHDSPGASIFPHALHISRLRESGCVNPAFSAMLPTSASNAAALVGAATNSWEAASCK